MEVKMTMKEYKELERKANKLDSLLELISGMDMQHGPAFFDSTGRRNRTIESVTVNPEKFTLNCVSIVCNSKVKSLIIKE